MEMNRPILHLGNDYTLAALSPCGRSVLAATADNALHTFQCGDVELDTTRSNPSAGPLYRPKNGPYHVFSRGGSSVRTVLPSPTTEADFLVAAVDHPIQLLSGWSNASTDVEPRIERSLSLVHGTQDALLNPYTITYARTSQEQTYLIAGADKTIATFDIDQPGGTIHRRHLQTLASNSTASGAPNFLTGSISALDCNDQTGLLAAGSHSRGIAVFDGHGLGQSVLSFTLQGSEFKGSGISHLRWSLLRPWYLYIAERNADVALVFDVRMLSQIIQPLTVLGGRKSTGMLKTGLDLSCDRNSGEVDMYGNDADSTETLLCGGSDGYLRGWQDVWSKAEEVPSTECVLPDKEGYVQPTWSRKVDDYPITVVIAHPDGGIVTTAARDRHDTADTHKDWWEGSDDGSDADDGDNDVLD